MVPLTAVPEVADRSWSREDSGRVAVEYSGGLGLVDAGYEEEQPLWLRPVSLGDLATGPAIKRPDRARRRRLPPPPADTTRPSGHDSRSVSDPRAWDPASSALMFGPRDAVLVDALETVPEGTQWPTAYREPDPGREPTPSGHTGSSGMKSVNHGMS